MDPQFQELANEVADAVEKRLAGDFEQRLKTHVDETVEKHVSGGFEERIATNVERRLSGAFEERIKTHVVDTLEERIKEHIDKFEERAELRMKMHFESLETKVTLAAEGYGGTLQKIERELVDLNKKVDTKFDDHSTILRDHGTRIAELEKR